jgi:hypothetical protein
VDKREEYISEIRRISTKLGVLHLTQKDFARNSKMGISTICNTFGSWNRAIEAAGLQTMKNYIPAHPTIPDIELLEEIIRLTNELRKKPSIREMNALGKYSVRPYLKRWGSYSKGRELAYLKLGYPDLTDVVTDPARTPLIIDTNRTFIPDTFKPRQTSVKKKVQFGEPIDFRGLRFAPINEQGVVYLFGMISRELGFLIESIRTEYPDCEGKRCVDKKENRWEHILIEFEFKSSNFRDHFHSSEDCDLIVCWIHDWEDCPVEVLELRSSIKYL